MVSPSFFSAHSPTTTYISVHFIVNSVKHIDVNNVDANLSQDEEIMLPLVYRLQVPD